MMVNLLFFFFSSRRRHTRLQGDWSSDVCSSDLRGEGAIARQARNIVAVKSQQFMLTYSSPAPAPGASSRSTRSTDRKSTRLNSSHLVISYAVFCLKKKKKNNAKPNVEEYTADHA